VQLEALLAKQCLLRVAACALLATTTARRQNLCLCRDLDHDPAEQRQIAPELAAPSSGSEWSKV